MMIPAKSRNNIRDFIARYFIEDAMPDEQEPPEKGKHER